MKYEPEPLDCPICHKRPEFFKRWDSSEKMWQDGWNIACECTPDRSAIGDDKIEAVASWNQYVDNFDENYEKHRYQDENIRKEIIEDMKKFRKLIEEHKNEWDN